MRFTRKEDLGLEVDDFPEVELGSLHSTFVRLPPEGTLLRRNDKMTITVRLDVVGFEIAADRERAIVEAVARAERMIRLVVDRVRSPGEEPPTMRGEVEP